MNTPFWFILRISLYRRKQRRMVRKRQFDLGLFPVLEYPFRRNRLFFTCKDTGVDGGYMEV